MKSQKAKHELTTPCETNGCNNKATHLLGTLYLCKSCVDAVGTEIEGPAEQLGEALEGSRGFPRVAFKDAYDHDCSLLASSAIGDYEDSMERPGSSFLWIGLNEAEANVMAINAEKVGVRTNAKVGWVPYPIPEEVSIWTRMHLNREQVAGLVIRLEQWLETGRFE